MYHHFKDMSGHGFFLVFVSYALTYVYSGEPVCTSKFDYDYKMLQTILELEMKFKALDEKVKLQQSLIEKMSADGPGSVYVRWGRTVCPTDARLIYSGYMAGKKHHEQGSGTNSLCLPSDPSWFKYTEGADQWRGRIYGTEVENDGLFDYHVFNQDMPCAVCRSIRSAVLMIPGRTSCYTNLTLEYSGYLMSEYHNRSSPQDYICLDIRPEFLPNGKTNSDQHVLYHVESLCGSLPCPPYVEGRELACVVCTL